MRVQLLLDLYVALVGLVVGSYLNVVIHRLPREESTVLPRSRCPRCGAQLRVRDNLPLLSFLMLRGRCRQCQAPISWRYPLVEAATAGLFVGALEAFGLTWHAAAAAAFGSALVALAAIDYEHFLLPDVITLPGIAVGLLISLFADWIDWRQALLGAALGGGGLWLLARLWLLLRHEEGMGLGDVKMLAMVGALLGWQGVVVTVFLGSLAGAVVGLTLIALGRLDLGSRLPFGVFLAGGALVALFAGPALVARYSRLLG
jgi:leader peptidase (prepilin peptidase) / N-methyltransferase